MSFVLTTTVDVTPSLSDLSAFPLVSVGLTTSTLVRSTRIFLCATSFFSLGDICLSASLACGCGRTIFSSTGALLFSLSLTNGVFLLRVVRSASALHFFPVGRHVPQPSFFPIPCGCLAEGPWPTTGSCHPLLSAFFYLKPFEPCVSLASHYLCDRSLFLCKVSPSHRAPIFLLFVAWLVFAFCRFVRGLVDASRRPLSRGGTCSLTFFFFFVAFPFFSTGCYALLPCLCSLFASWFSCLFFATLIAAGFFPLPHAPFLSCGTLPAGRSAMTFPDEPLSIRPHLSLLMLWLPPLDPPALRPDYFLTTRVLVYHRLWLTSSPSVCASLH